MYHHLHCTESWISSRNFHHHLLESPFPSPILWHQDLPAPIGNHHCFRPRSKIQSCSDVLGCGCKLHPSYVYWNMWYDHKYLLFSGFAHLWLKLIKIGKQITFTHLFMYSLALNLSSPKGGCNNPLTVFALVLKIAQPRGKIAPGTFKFIISLHFSWKIPNLPPTPGVG